jgi:hypothetical protein
VWLVLGSLDVAFATLNTVDLLPDCGNSMAAFLIASSDIRMLGGLGASSLGVTAADDVIGVSLLPASKTSAAALVFLIPLMGRPVAATTGASLLGSIIFWEPLSVAVVIVFAI